MAKECIHQYRFYVGEMESIRDGTSETGIWLGLTYHNQTDLDADNPDENFIVATVDGQIAVTICPVDPSLEQVMPGLYAKVQSWQVQSEDGTLPNDVIEYTDELIGLYIRANVKSETLESISLPKDETLKTVIHGLIISAYNLHGRKIAAYSLHSFDGLFESIEVCTANPNAGDGLLGYNRYYQEEIAQESNIMTPERLHAHIHKTLRPLTGFDLFPKLK